MTNSDLYGANLRGADLRGADLRGADLMWKQLISARMDERTRLPTALS
ncbi:pentapeptide repeat-containing protein [Streptomyces scopuliridis]